MHPDVRAPGTLFPLVAPRRGQIDGTTVNKVGLISFFLYRFIQARSPDSAQTTFLFLAIGLVVVFTVLAAVVFKMRGFIEMTILHLVYAAGFGWICLNYFPDSPHFKKSLPSCTWR
jgi:type IV secretory pathway TrbL component